MSYRSPRPHAHTHTCAYICRFCFFMLRLLQCVENMHAILFHSSDFDFDVFTTRSVMGYRGRMETVVLLRQYKTCKTVSQVKCHATMPHNWGQATHTHSHSDQKKLFASTKLCCGNGIGALIACVSVCTFAVNFCCCYLWFTSVIDTQNFSEGKCLTSTSNTTAIGHIHNTAINDDHSHWALFTQTRMQFDSI